MTTYYKVLNENGTTCHVGVGSWHLPVGNRHGKWMPKLDEHKLEPCIFGYHLLRREDVIFWIGPALFVAESSGTVIVSNNKVVTARARLISRLDTWNERTARLFATDCAEQVLGTIPYHSRKIFKDAIQTARLFADRKCSAQDLSAARIAARSAAESAAWSAAGIAAESAAWSAARSAAESAAESAARSAAESAAWSAAWSAARSAARSWQTERLFYYLDGEKN